MRHKVYSVFKGKCPECLQGDVFQYKHTYDLKNFDKMYAHCPHCGTKYEKETGYWYGAMYVSYGMTVAFSVAAFVSAFLLSSLFNWKIPLFGYFAIICITITLLIPVTFRGSRLIWMNLFSAYDPDKATK